VITEALLEMHFHRPLMELFRGTFGFGETGNLNFYKYSQQRECFVGFDQAFARSDLSEIDFFNLLRDAASRADYVLGDKFIGYFLQFKVVREMQSIKRRTPPQITSRPHYRASLDTKRNLNTGVSQHELLYKLSRNRGAFVYYACPMVFDRSRIYEVDVDLDDLRLADLLTCSSPYNDNDNHFIYFDDPRADPIWCSEPVEGKALPPRIFAEMLTSRLNDLEPGESAKLLLDTLNAIRALEPEGGLKSLGASGLRSALSLVEDSLAIIRVRY
jgi:hypothetical protein